MSMQIAVAIALKIVASGAQAAGSLAEKIRGKIRSASNSMTVAL